MTEPLAAMDANIPDNIAWLIAELQETRRLGNQLADACKLIADYGCFSDVRAIDEWRDHQKDNGE